MLAVTFPLMHIFGASIFLIQIPIIVAVHFFKFCGMESFQLIVLDHTVLDENYEELY